MSTRSCCLFLTLVLLFGGACGEQSGRLDQDDEQGSLHEDGKTYTPFITDGVTDSGHYSVGQLIMGQSGCTATLIGKQSVLTAAHCISYGTATFKVGGQRYRSQKTVRHPNYTGNVGENDIAVIILQQAVTGVSPSPINNTTPYVGQTVTLVGFGQTSEWGGGSGVKRKGTNTISNVSSTTISFRGTGNGKSNTCYGDSGGPAFISLNGKEAVAGVTSGGPRPCGTMAIDTRVDAYQSWLTSNTNGDITLPGGGSTPPTPPSGGSCHSGDNFGWDYCSTSCKCDKGEGDCDSDSECEAGLVCNMDVGAKYGASPTVDVCEAPGGETPSPEVNCHTGANFGWDYCTSSCPCDDGEGDCDSDSECKPGLVCNMDVGAKYSTYSTVDVCEKPSNGSTPGSTAKEGESCTQNTCGSGLACVPVYSSSDGQIIGQYCMEICTTLGADPVCEAQEQCVQSRSSGRVCFNPNNPNQGFTTP